LNLKHFIQGINGIIPGGISLNDYSMIVQTNHVTAKRILDELIEIGIGIKQGNSFHFNSGDRLKCALLALQKGAPIDQVSEQIDWKDFEGLVGEILESKGFGTMRNLILTKPKMEIDVVGVKFSLAILIDCKHWRRINTSSLESIVNKQVERTKNYVSQTKGSIAIPAIVTLYQEKVDFIKKVPIIPIQKFSSFVDEIYGNLDKIQTIKSY